jgi:hypothetical protein
MAQAKDDGGVNLEAGMSLYDLKHFELVGVLTGWPGHCLPLASAQRLSRHFT